jgi:ubiquinone biosynthesis protein
MRPLRFLKIFFILTFCGALFPFRKIRFTNLITIPFEVFSLLRIAQTKGERLRHALTKIGPSAIKLGQLLSTRDDLVGSKMAEELSSLQDNLPPFSFKKVKAIIEQQLKKPLDELFRSFSEKPIAAASIAQVHQAINHNGQKVAVKVLRPKIEILLKRDIELLLFFAKFADSFTRLKRLRFHEVILTLKATTERETNLKFEAASASELAENLRDDDVVIPTIDWKKTSHRVLTMSWVEGKAVKAENKQLAAELITLYLKQAYRDGFFHADMHPGNIFITTQNKLALIDFGIMGRLSEETRLYVAQIFYGFIKRDYQYVAEIHVKAGYVPADVDVADFALACRTIGEPIFGLANSDISIAQMLANMLKITELYGMQTQPQLLLLQKTLLTIEGVTRQLDPSINMWEVSKPWLEKWAKKNLSKKAQICHETEKLKATLAHIPTIIVNTKTLTEKMLNHHERRGRGTLKRLTILTVWTAFVATLAGYLL